MAGSTTTSVSWDRQLLREKTRQKRKREGGKQTELGDRLEEHEFPKKVLGEAKDPAALFPEYEVMVKRLLDGEDPAPPLENKHCPFHHVLLEQKVSANQWAYYRCPIRACPMFCGADRVDDWLTCLSSQLNSSYKEQPDQDLNISLPFVCFCKHELYQDLKLGKSRSPKNPNRFFLTCKHKHPSIASTGCKFFQWLDLPLLSSNAKAWIPA